jgi:hypothetical protein
MRGSHGLGVAEFITQLLEDDLPHGQAHQEPHASTPA